MSAIAPGKLIPVIEWAKQKFDLRIPHPNTLRRWIHEGRIYPKATKVGKNWFVPANAEYQGDE